MTVGVMSITLCYIKLPICFTLDLLHKGQANVVTPIPNRSHNSLFQMQTAYTNADRAQLAVLFLGEGDVMFCCILCSCIRREVSEHTCAACLLS